MHLNRVELIGFLGADAESKLTPTGKAVTTLSLATKTFWMKGEERQERTEWHRIQVWAKLGEYAAAFKKGAHIRVQGELRSREYETEAGKVRTYDIVADSILNLRSGQRYNGQEPEADSAPPSEPADEPELAAAGPRGKRSTKSQTEERP